jgi:hypothetical protein
VLDTLLKPFSGLLDWAGRRATRGVVCDVRESRRVGGENDPGVYVTVVAENPQGENAFVDAFEVEMLEPFRAPAVRYEYRSTPNTAIAHLALNIPGHGVSDPVIVIAFFDQHLPYTSPCQARIAAVGRRGFRRRWQELSCAALKP